MSEQKKEMEFNCRNCEGKVVKSFMGGFGHVIATGCIKPQVSRQDWLIYLKNKKTEKLVLEGKKHE